MKSHKDPLQPKINKQAHTEGKKRHYLFVILLSDSKEKYDSKVLNEKKKNRLDCITQVAILEEKISELEIKTEKNNFK